MSVFIDTARYDAVLFDLDGVITDTAAVHLAAWKQLFDAYLGRRSGRAGEDHSPFTEDDYRRYVDGKPRYDGVADVLEARGISLPHGEPSDDEDAETVVALGNRKNRFFQQQLADTGVRVFDTSVALVRCLQEAGLGTAVFSSSRNCGPVLESAGLDQLFPVRVDGVVAAELGLPGKPDPAVLLEAARRLDADPGRCVVVEDAEAGVEAGARGGFALVIGVDRTGHADALRRAGADAVVADLGDVTVSPRGRRMSEVPNAFDAWERLEATVTRRRHLAVFLDFDGTLSDIVDDPDSATLVDGAAEALTRLAARCPVAIISGRDLRDVRSRVGVDGLWFAGSHGFDLQGPAGERHQQDDAAGARPALHDAAAALRDALDDVPGVRIEDKEFAVAVHYRTVDDDLVDRVRAAVTDLADHDDRLRLSHGRQVIELRPDLDWDKGSALRWLLQHVYPDAPATPIYAGDDITDEDALDAVRQTGLGIVVRHAEHGDRISAAHVAVDDPVQLCQLLRRLGDVLERRR